MAIGLSQHPSDRLIRALVRTERPATAGELDEIVERTTSAPFDRQVVPVPTTPRGLTYDGHTPA